MGIQKLISGCGEFHIDIPNNLKKPSNLVLNAAQLTPDIAEAIVRLWESDCIKQVLQYQKFLQLPGGLSGITYYVNNVRRFSEEDYEPTSEDVIRAKLRTTGVTEVSFEIGNQEYNLIDIGGQRSERRKWLHCFETVHIIIYMIAINEYDMVLEEDGNTNRFEEALKLFQLLTSTQWLRHIPCVLIMNKTDLFKEEIVNRPLEENFPEYQDFLKEKNGLVNSEDQYKLGLEFMRQKCSKYFEGRNLYVIETCAIDKEDCDKVFRIIRREMIEKAMCLSGLNQFF
jgi:guanine nucleotide-binding protein subunit alpha